MPKIFEIVKDINFNVEVGTYVELASGNTLKIIGVNSSNANIEKPHMQIQYEKDILIAYDENGIAYNHLNLFYKLPEYNIIQFFNNHLPMACSSDDTLDDMEPLIRLFRD